MQLFLPSLLLFALVTAAASSPSDGLDADVIVVGGGISGLYAAHELQYNSNLSVLVNRPEIITANILRAKTSANLPLQGARGPRSPRWSNSHRTPHTSSHRSALTLYRTQVPADNGDGIDLGAHWIGRTQHHVIEFLKRFNMTGLLYNQYISGTKVLEISGKISHYKTTLPWLGPLRELDFGLFIAAISAVIKDVSRDSPWNASAFVMEHDGMTTQSFCSGFPWDKATSEVTAAATRAVFGKEIEELSALQYAHYAACSGGVLPLLDASPGGAQEFKLLGGTQQISETLAQPLHIVRDRNVVAIHQDGSSVTVRAFDSAFSVSTYSARRVVVATPPHISAAFQYSPPLPPNKQKLLQHLTQGHMIKTVITYPAAFWRQNGFSGEVVSSSDPVSICYDDSIPHGSSTLAPALVCFVAGRSGVAASKLTLQQRQQLVLSKLAEYFGPDALHPKQCDPSSCTPPRLAATRHAPQRYFELDWAKEPFTGGCPVGTANAGVITMWGDAIRDAHARVNFAGTEAATWWPGYMSGALQSGARAAIEVLTSEGLPVPQSLVDFERMGPDTPSIALK